VTGGGPDDARHTVEWRLAGGDRVALVVASGIEVRALEGSARTVHVAEVVVDLRQRIVLQGTCAVVLTACELMRFTREVGELVAGDAELATLRSYGEAASLVLAASGRDASLSGFIGHSFIGSLSFNDLKLRPSALHAAYQALRELAPRCAPAAAGLRAWGRDDQPAA
jgi:hypothetical protein